MSTGLRVPKGATPVSAVSNTKSNLTFESRIVVSTNSPDLERGPGTRSIGEEFGETTILVIEL